jgi:hypothetical protein
MAAFLCKKHNCNDKSAKLHFDQIVNLAWNPHPAQEFVEWWSTHSDFQNQGVAAETARNCKCYVNQYKDAVEVGAAELPIDYPK